MTEDLISIIIPVYNKENELNHCVDSVLKQSHQKLQIILINDGSTDNSGQICDAYLEVDDHIEVYHQTNKGISYTRNKGLELVRGTYCMFVDGDDYVGEHYVHNLYQTLLSTGVDIAACQYIVTSDKTLTQPVKFEDFEQEVVVLDSEKMLHNMLYHSFAEISVCDKLFNIRLFDSLRFPIDQIYEDLYLVPRLVMKADRIAIHFYEDYFNYLSEESIQRSEFRINKLAAVNYMKEINEQLIDDKQVELKQAGAYRYFDIICELLFQIKGHEYREIRQYLWAELLSVRSVVRKDRHPNASRARFGAYLTYTGYVMMSLVYRIHFKLKHG